MKTAEFITEYKKADNVMLYIQENIKKDIYVDYQEKITTCENIIKSTSVAKVDEAQVFKRNSPAEFMIFSLTLIDKYSNIDVNFKDVLNEYNSLEKEDLINKIIQCIPEKEYATFNAVLGMVRDDYYENNRTIISYLETKFEAIKLAFHSIMDAFTEAANNEDLLNTLSEKTGIDSDTIKNVLENPDLLNK